MEPFKNFNTFIANFIPGFILFFILVIFSSLIFNTDLLKINYFQNTFFIIIGSAIMGIFVDDIRHFLIEEKLEKRWSKKTGKNIDEDFVVCAPKIGVDIYKLVRDEFYYYYEFDFNMGLVFLFGSIILPFPLLLFYHFGCFLIVLSFIVPVVLGFAFCYFGKEGYYYFLNALVEIKNGSIKK